MEFGSKRRPAGSDFEPPSCIGGRAVTFTMREKRSGVTREFRLAVPNGWTRAAFLRYVRRVHGGRYGVRIIDWDTRIWVANPEAFENFRYGKPTKEWA